MQDGGGALGIAPRRDCNRQCDDDEGGGGVGHGGRRMQEAGGAVDAVGIYILFTIVLGAHASFLSGEQRLFHISPAKPLQGCGRCPPPPRRPLHSGTRTLLLHGALSSLRGLQATIAVSRLIASHRQSSVVSQHLHNNIRHSSSTFFC